jgi:hypothetical protein
MLENKFTTGKIGNDRQGIGVFDRKRRLFPADHALWHHALREGSRGFMDAIDIKRPSNARAVYTHTIGSESPG